MPSLVDYNRIYLDRSWHWLNDPEVKALTLTPDFTREAQEIFFHSLPQKAGYWIKGIEEKGVPVGAMGLKNITTEDAEYWGYIGEKEYWGKGIGSFLIREAIAQATKLGLKQLYLHVSRHNTRAINLYSKMGFRLAAEGEVEKYLLDI